MGLAIKVKMLMAARKMPLQELAKELGTTPPNLAAKLRHDNLSEKDLHDIAKACDATFESVFSLNDTGKEI